MKGKRRKKLSWEVKNKLHNIHNVVPRTEFEKDGPPSRNYEEPV